LTSKLNMNVCKLVVVATFVIIVKNYVFCLKNEFVPCSTREGNFSYVRILKRLVATCHSFLIYCVFDVHDTGKDVIHY
jgi:hypothetical protein